MINGIPYLSISFDCPEGVKTGAKCWCEDVFHERIATVSGGGISFQAEFLERVRGVSEHSVHTLFFSAPANLPSGTYKLSMMFEIDGKQYNLSKNFTVNP